MPLRKLCTLALVVNLLFCNFAHAQSLLCVAKSTRVKNNKVANSKLLKVVTTAACPRGYTQILNTSSFAGAQGATGPAGPTGATGATGASGENGANGSAGADGQLRIYGDGSAGALLTTGFDNIANANLQFTSCTIATGTFLNVPSGTILRCSGDVVISGSILVGAGGSGGQLTSLPSLNVFTSSGRAAHPGKTRTVAANGELGSNNAVIDNAPFSFSMGNEEAYLSYAPSLYAGGGGGGSAGIGGSGGGYFAILASGSITLTNTASINAIGQNGTTGSGGGGGGIIVLASKTSITIPAAATISVAGGIGGPSTTTTSNGGGGGGGGIYIYSPSNTVNSTGFVISGGAAGDPSTNITSNIAFGGGAGGGSIGSSGRGGGIAASRPVAPTTALSGADGISQIMTVDPTALF